MDLWNPQYQNDLTIEGGGSKVAYMVAASQYHQKGYTPGNFFDRYTLRSNVQAHPLEWLKTGVNLNLSLSNTQQNPNWGSAANGMSNYTSGGLSFLLLPLYPAVDENGNLPAERFSDGRPVPQYQMSKNPEKRRPGRVQKSSQPQTKVNCSGTLLWILLSGSTMYLYSSSRLKMFL